MDLRIDPLPGYTPNIGRLVCILGLARQSLTSAVRGLTTAQLDHLQDARSNSIGALLAHAEAVEWWYQVAAFEGHEPTRQEEAPRLAALNLGEEGRQQLKGYDLETHLANLARRRQVTLEKLAQNDDAWLEQPLAGSPIHNVYWGWFHVAEDEIGHAGQIRWLRARLP